MFAVAEDADVTAERRRVSAAAAAGGLRDIISITNLRKQYDNSSKKVCDWFVAYLQYLECCRPCASILCTARFITANSEVRLL